MTRNTVLKVLAFAWVLGGVAGGLSCDCVPDKPSQEDDGDTPGSASADSAGFDDTTGSDSTSASGTSAPGGTGGPPPDSSWAVDTFHFVQETHGETQQFKIDKITILPDGTTEQRTILCGVPEHVTVGRWRAQGERSVVVEPVAGAETVVFAEGHNAKLLLHETDDCRTITFESYSPTGKFQGTDNLTRGDVCLNCSATGQDQVQVCGGQPLHLPGSLPPCE